MNSQYGHLLQISDPDVVPVIFLQRIETAGDNQICVELFRALFVCSLQPGSCLDCDEGSACAELLNPVR